MPELSPQTLTILVVIAKLLIGALVAKFRDLNKRQRDTEKDLNDFKLSAAKDYAASASITDALNRLNGRLDDLFKEVHKKN